MKEVIVTQVTFILKINLEGSVLVKYDHFLNATVAFLNRLLGWECAYVCHD